MSAQTRFKKGEGQTVATAPSNCLHLVVFNEGSLDAIDNYAPHAKLAHDLEEWRPAHEEFLSCIRYKRFRQCHHVNKCRRFSQDVLKPYSVAPRIIKASPLPLFIAVQSLCVSWSAVTRRPKPAMQIRTPCKPYEGGGFKSNLEKRTRYCVQ
jgi:hypothetical protein